jgi:hypothetical protein
MRSSWAFPRTNHCHKINNVNQNEASLESNLVLDSLHSHGIKFKRSSPFISLWYILNLSMGITLKCLFFPRLPSYESHNLASSWFLHMKLKVITLDKNILNSMLHTSIESHLTHISWVYSGHKSNCQFDFEFFFCHNLYLRIPNGKLECTFDIYILKKIQQYILF